MSELRPVNKFAPLGSFVTKGPTIRLSSTSSEEQSIAESLKNTRNVPTNLAIPEENRGTRIDLGVAQSDIAKASSAVESIAEVRVQQETLATLVSYSPQGKLNSRVAAELSLLENETTRIKNNALAENGSNLLTSSQTYGFIKQSSSSEFVSTANYSSLTSGVSYSVSTQTAAATAASSFDAQLSAAISAYGGTTSAQSKANNIVIPIIDENPVEEISESPSQTLDEKQISVKGELVQQSLKETGILSSVENSKKEEVELLKLSLE